MLLFFLSSFVKVSKDLIKALKANRVLDLQRLVLQVTLKDVFHRQITLSAVTDLRKYVQGFIFDLLVLGHCVEHLLRLDADRVMVVLIALEEIAIVDNRQEPTTARVLVRCIGLGARLDHQGTLAILAHFFHNKTI